MAWTPEKVQSYHAGHLYEAAEWIERQHPRWTDHFGRQVAQLQGLGWEGSGFENALAEEQHFQISAQGMAAHATLAAQDVREAAGVVDATRSTAWNAIATAQEDDFEVNLDKGVRDNLPPNPVTSQARQAAAQAHAAHIATSMQAFKGSLSAAAAVVQGHAATHRGITMTDYKTDGMGSPPGGPPISPDPSQQGVKKSRSFGDTFDSFAKVVGGAGATVGGIFAVGAGAATEVGSDGLSTPISIPTIAAGATAIAGGVGSVEKGLNELFESGQ